MYRICGKTCPLNPAVAAVAQFTVEVMERRRLLAGYVPLAATSSPVWLTGYFAQTGTIDLQSAAALAPNVSGGQAASMPRDVAVNANGLPLLESRANGAGLELFVDFARDDGYYGTYSLDADRANFNSAEQLAIYSCWRNLVGIFSQFDVNVTTVLPPTTASDPNFAWMQITNEFAGGAAYVNSLTKSGPTGKDNSGDVLGRVSGIAHEFGHILGLAHQADYDKYGNVTNEYSNGDGYRNVPLMGIDYNGQPSSRMWYGRGQWQTLGVDIQDDVQVVANTVSSVVGGDGMRPDDFGNSIATAYTLPSGSQQIDAFSERYSDADVFKISPTTSGNWNITATPQYDSQAQPKLELLDASGNVIAARDDATMRSGPTNEQFLNINMSAGTYYARVSSGGDYGELGYYKFAATQLPSYFVSNDIGVPAMDGSVTYNSSTGIFTESAGGTDIWNTSDQFRYTYETLTGDGSITARVESLDNIGYWTKAGVMIRQSTDANSAHAYIGLNPSGAVETIQRTSAGASAGNVAAAGNSGPWVRITRAGNSFTLARSGDGSTWTTVGTTTITLSSQVLIGLASCAWSSQYEALATFSNVTVTGNVTPAGTTYNALPAPTSLVAIPASGANTSANLTWSAVAGATGYRIERSIDGVSFGTVATVGSGTLTYTDVNLWGSNRYFYRVSASDGSANYSVPASANLVNKPNTPGTPGYSTSVIGRGTTEIDLNWLDVQGETGYRIDKSTDGINFTTASTVSANRTSVNLTGLAAGTAYIFRIYPMTSVGDGQTTPLVISTETRMAAVGNLRFTTKSLSSMTIAWDDSSRETGFRVERSLDGTNWTFMGDAAQNVTTWTDSNITSGSEYYYRVQAWDAAFAGIMIGAIFAAAPTASLPAGWTNADIGTVAGSGAATNSGTNWTTIGSGTDVYGTADSFNFTYRAVTTNATIIARVESVETTDNAAKAGLMIRQDLTAGSKSVAVMMNAGGGYGIDLRGRTTVNSGTSYQQLLGNVTAPYWLKLARNGAVISASYSTDGVTFSSPVNIGISLTGTCYIGMAVTSYSTTLLNTSSFSNVSLSVAGSSPTVVTPAAANPSTITGTSTALSVLGADDGGESNLTYTWSVTVKPTGAGDPTYSVNGTNAAKNTVVTFSAAGAYTFSAAITDATGLSTASFVNVIVNAVGCSIVVSPAATTLKINGSRQLTSTMHDQFGAALASQPSFNWSIASGGGSVSATGLYTAPAVAGAATVQAGSGSITGNAVVTIVSFTDRLAWYHFNESSGTNAADSSGNNNTASLSGSYGFVSGVSGNALSLTGGYATLPNGIMSGVSDFTFAARVKLSSLDAWSRIFDFGTGTTSYMFLTPQSGATGRPRFAITTGGYGSEQVIDSSVAISANVWTHIAVRLAGNIGTLFVNGVAAGTNTSMTLHPTALGTTTQNYLGKSQFSDPALSGALDEVRIYNRALSPVEIARLNDSTAPQVSSAIFSFESSQSLGFTFSEDVLESITSATFAATNLSVNTTISADDWTLAAQGGAGVATTAMLTRKPGLSPLADGNYRVTASNVLDFAGNPLAPYTFDFHFLNADANRDRKVNTLDFNLLAGSFGGAGKVFSQGDFDYSGTIDSGDFNILAAQYGKSLPAPVATGMATASAFPVVESPFGEQNGLTEDGLLEEYPGDSLS